MGIQRLHLLAIKAQQHFGDRKFDISIENECTDNQLACIKWPSFKKERRGGGVLAWHWIKNLESKGLSCKFVLMGRLPVNNI